MIERINTSFTVGVDKATKKAADAIGKVGDALAGKPEDAVDSAVLIRLNSAYSENYLMARNAQDSISYQQTRETALETVGSSLQELRELALSAGSPAVSDSDREIIAQQTASIMNDISSMIGDAQFNGHNILEDLNMESLGLTSADINENGIIASIDKAIQVVNTKRIETGGQITALEARIDNLSANNAALADAAAGYTGTLLEDITELSQSVTQAMVATKALDAVLELDKEKVSSLVDLMNPPVEDK